MSSFVAALGVIPLSSTPTASIMITGTASGTIDHWAHGSASSPTVATVTNKRMLMRARSENVTGAASESCPVAIRIAEKRRKPAEPKTSRRAAMQPLSSSAGISSVESLCASSSARPCSSPCAPCAAACVRRPKPAPMPGRAAKMRKW
eukprot:4542157-Prymnesium_polylepis.1